MSIGTTDGFLSAVEHFTTSDGETIAYRDVGDGTPLVMVHGWSQSGAMFHHQVKALSRRHRVIAMDQRGHGESPTPSGGLRISRLAADVKELIDHLHLNRPSLLGWSMGVSVIWSYIDLFGTRSVNKLVFVDQPSMLTALPGMPEGEKLECGTLFDWQNVIELYVGLSSEGGHQLRSGFVAGMVTKTIPPDLLQWILDENSKTPLPVAAALLLSHCTNDWRDVLRRIDRPTLVICGSVSHVGTQSQRFVHESIPGSKFHEFPADQGGAHFPFLEAPEAFNTVVERFLAE